MFCPGCGKQADEGDAFCRHCGHSLSAGESALGKSAHAPDPQAPAATAQSPLRRSGEATASLVLGLFSFAPVVGLLAVIFGHLAKASIRRSGGQLLGDGMATLGLLLGYLGLAGWLTYGLSIVITPLFQSQRAIDRASVVGDLIEINSANTSYASTYDHGYAPRLAALGPPRRSKPSVLGTATRLKAAKTKATALRKPELHYRLSAPKGWHYGVLAKDPTDADSCYTSPGDESIKKWVAGKIAAGEIETYKPGAIAVTTDAASDIRSYSPFAYSVRVISGEDRGKVGWVSAKLVRMTAESRRAEDKWDAAEAERRRRIKAEREDTGVPSPDAAGLIGGDLASGEKSDYRFTYTPSRGKDGEIEAYTVQADPVTRREKWHYWTDETGVIREEYGKPASAASSPVP